jgi:hypothetical protein
MVEKQHGEFAISGVIGEAGGELVPVDFSIFNHNYTEYKNGKMIYASTVYYMFNGTHKQEKIEVQLIELSRDEIRN